MVGGAVGGVRDVEGDGEAMLTGGGMRSGCEIAEQGEAEKSRFNKAFLILCVPDYQPDMILSQIACMTRFVVAQIIQTGLQPMSLTVSAASSAVS